MDNNSLYSIDRLVEFGMEMAICQQIFSTMNQAMKQMNIAGAMNQLNYKLQNELLYFVIDNTSKGPYSIKEMLSLINDKTINNITLVWMSGMKNWERIDNVPSLLKYIAIHPNNFPEFF
jgi:hypothetical protein